MGYQIMLSNWVLVIYLGFFSGAMRIEYDTEAQCKAAAREWRALNPASDAELTCVQR